MFNAQPTGTRYLWAMTLNESQVHSNWNKSVKISHVYQVKSAHMHPNGGQFKGIFHKITYIEFSLWILIVQTTFSMSLNKPNGCGSTTVILNEGQVHSNWNQKAQFRGFCDQAKFESNWSVFRMHDNRKGVFSLNRLSKVLSLEYYSN